MKPKHTYISWGDLSKNAKPTNAFKEAEAAFRAEHANELIDPVALRHRQDWSILANQVVGAEDPEAR